MPVPADRLDQGRRERPSGGAGGDHSCAGSRYAGGIEDLSTGAPGGDGLVMAVRLGQVERYVRVLGQGAGPIAASDDEGVVLDGLGGQRALGRPGPARRRR